MTKQLTKAMLTELAQTDKAMTYANKKQDTKLYEEYLNIHFGIISDWNSYNVPSQKQFINLINWCAEHRLY